MSGEARGMVGSVLVHLLIISGFVGFSWFAAGRASEEMEPVDPLLVDLTGPANRRPGEIGKAAGVAKGAPDAPKGLKSVRIKPLDMEAVRRAQEQPEASAQSASSSKSDPKKGPKSVSKGATGKSSLSEFLSSKGGKSGSSGKSGSIGGVTVRGRSTGTGENGGEGGSAGAKQLYAGEVLARFRSVWVDIVSQDGGEIQNVGACGVTLTVDASGNVRFGSWIRQPSDPRIAELVRRACARIGNCGPPPGGSGFGIDFPNVSVSGG